MKILMTADTVGGVWSYSLELARALRPYDVHVALFTMGRKLSAEQRVEVKHIDNIELHESEFKLEWMEEPWADVEAAGERLLDLGTKFSADLVHLNGYAHAALPWSAPTLVVCHSCVLSWWKAVRQEALPETWRPYRDKVTRGLRAADVIVAPSRAMLDAILESYGVLQARCMVIPNGVDSSPYTPAQKRPFAFSAGRLWDPAKNVSALEQAAEAIHWPVYVAGELANRPKNLSSALPSGSFQAVGHLPRKEMIAWLAAASIYCAPARYEPFGLSILEAALCGCALVLGDIESLREVWADAALFVDPEDHNRLCRLIHELSYNNRLREEYGRRARARAIEFTAERMAQRYMELYRLMVSSSNDGPGTTQEVTCAS